MNVEGNVIRIKFAPDAFSRSRQLHNGTAYNLRLPHVTLYKGFPASYSNFHGHVSRRACEAHLKAFGNTLYHTKHLA